MCTTNKFSYSSIEKVAMVCISGWVIVFHSTCYMTNFLYRCLKSSTILSAWPPSCTKHEAREIPWRSINMGKSRSCAYRSFESEWEAMGDKWRGHNSSKLGCVWWDKRKQCTTKFYPLLWEPNRNQFNRVTTIHPMQQEYEHQQFLPWKTFPNVRSKDRKSTRLNSSH